jgi:hypothetical protein
LDWRVQAGYCREATPVLSGRGVDMFNMPTMFYSVIDGASGDPGGRNPSIFSADQHFLAENLNSD